MTEEYKNTIFKSAYYYNKQPCFLFVNYGVGGHESFSFIAKKANFTLVHNLTKDEKIPLLKNMLAKLTPEELKLVIPNGT